MSDKKTTEDLARSTAERHHADNCSCLKNKPLCTLEDDINKVLRSYLLQESNPLLEALKESNYLMEMNLKYIMCGEHKLANKENKCHLCDAILSIQGVDALLTKAVIDFQKKHGGS